LNTMSGYLAAIVIFAAVAFCAKSQEGDDAGVPAEETDEGIDQDALTPQQLRGIHERMDKDKNGKASLTEVLNYAAEMRKIIAAKDIAVVLEEMDADKDGRLSLDELLKDMGKWSDGIDEEEKKESVKRADIEKEKFKVADTDKDGFLSVEELPSLFYPETHDGVLEVTAKHTLAQKDKDGDGQLSPKEFWEGEVVDGEDAAISDEEKEDFRRLDADGNGFLSSEELKEWESGMFHTKDAMRKIFDIADKDNDMHLSADEIEAARDMIAGTDAQFHFMEWAEHSEL